MRAMLAAMLLLVAVSATAAQALHTLQRGSFKQILAAHRGQPFVVAMWSVSCTHCSADLEIFRKLLAQNPGFRLVLISTDDPTQQGEIATMLDKFKLVQSAAIKGNVESWVFADTFSERLRYEIDPRWYGELPRTYFIDAAGKVRGVSGVLDEQATERWVKEGR